MLIETNMDLIRDNIPDIRFLYDIKDVLYDQEWFKIAPNFETYYMYRGLAKDENDKKTMGENNLRYDITVIPPKMFGAEFPKTLGHDHAKIEDSNMTYTEIYEVLEGEAHYLLQKYEDEKIIDVYAVHASAGQKCIVPPNYGHVTINASAKELIMANWSEANFKSDYSLFQKNHGACYYALQSKSPSPVVASSPAGERSNPADFAQTIAWQKNTNYDNVPELKINQAKDFNYLLENFGINSEMPMYDLVNDINKLNFLKNPQRYKWGK